MKNLKIEAVLSVALCTFNGEKYLHEQLDSLVNQTRQPNELVVCDDDSSDSTKTILENFALGAPFSVRIFYNNPRIGVVRNFERAIALCNGNYVAFCDQDDVWMRDKLQLLCDEMSNTESKYGINLPILVHTDLQVVSADLEIIHSSFMKMKHIFNPTFNSLNTLLVQNFVTGCTVLINRSLLNIAMPIPRNVIMHDWWFAQIAACTGKIVYIDHATIQYRQHLNNVVGATSLYTANNIRKALSSNHLMNCIRILYMQGKELQERIEKQSNVDMINIVRQFISAIEKGGIKGIYRLWSMQIFKQGVLRNLLFWFAVFHGKYSSGYFADKISNSEGMHK